MAIVRPFCAFRPRPDLAAEVASPPYDVIDTEEARALAAGSSVSFLHVTRPEIDLPVGTDEHAAEVYEAGATNLRTLIEDGVLVRDPEPHLYVYAQRMGAHTQAGVVGCASVSEYRRGLIKKHENTRPDKEDDRTRHIATLGAHDEPVFLTYRSSPGIDRAVAEAMTGAPTFDLTTRDGVQHRLWVLSRASSEELEELFAEVPALYVADGHHRSAAAARVHEELRGDGGEHDVFLAVVFPHDQMQILAYNRVVRDPKGRSPSELLAALGAALHLSPVSGREEASPTEGRSFGIYLGGRWYRAKVRGGSYDAADPVAALDCSICQDTLLGPIFDVQDPRRDKHIDFIGGIRGLEELERRVDSGAYSVAIALYPTQMTELMSVSDAGLLMPPKSTWFEPKLRSGLFVHTF